MYHFEDSSAGDTSIELSLEQVKDVAKKMGFEFKVILVIMPLSLLIFYIQKESMVSTTYTSNPESMLKYVYECAFWTAVKL